MLSNVCIYLAKASQNIDIPTKIKEKNANIFSYFFLLGFNCSIRTSAFPLSLKYANIRELFKKGDQNLKENYRQVSILTKVLIILQHVFKNF